MEVLCWFVAAGATPSSLSASIKYQVFEAHDVVGSTAFMATIGLLSALLTLSASWCRCCRHDQQPKARPLATILLVSFALFSAGKIVLQVEGLLKPHSNTEGASSTGGGAAAHNSGCGPTLVVSCEAWATIQSALVLLGSVLQATWVHTVHGAARKRYQQTAAAGAAAVAKGGGWGQQAQQQPFAGLVGDVSPGSEGSEDQEARGGTLRDGAQQQQSRKWVTTERADSIGRDGSLEQWAASINS